MSSGLFVALRRFKPTIGGAQEYAHQIDETPE